MRRASNLSLVMLSLAACTPVSALAEGQSSSSSHQAGLRPLTWPGQVRTSAPISSELSATTRPRVIPRGGYQPAPNPAPARVTTPATRQGLTPASHWLSPTPPPTPTEVAASTTSPITSAQTSQQPATEPEVAAAIADPMAPRHDAPIFRLGQGQTPAPVPSSSNQTAVVAAPPTHYAPSRYYSVHRQYGRQPDAAPIARPVYLDSLPVSVSGLGGGSDLAEPPAPPTLIRNHNGRIQVMPDLAGPDA